MNKDELLKVAGEPVAYIKTSTISGKRELSFSEECKTQKLQPLYTEAQLLAVAATTVSRSYAKGAEGMRERAAKSCEARAVAAAGMWPENSVAAYACADAIRALPITPTNTEGEQG